MAAALLLGLAAPAALVPPTLAAPRDCATAVPTIVATEDYSSVEGTEGDDVISANGKFDVRIDGRGGDDLICGGAGDDRLLGGAGDDRLEGGPGNDGFGGSPGDDTYFGGPGTNGLAYITPGPSGPVDIEVPTGRATHDGPGVRGYDEFTDITQFGGSPSDDTFVGSDAAELFDGEDGQDNVVAGGGDDTVLVHGGRVDGGPGDDHLVTTWSGRINAGAGDDDVRVETGAVSRQGEDLPPQPDVDQPGPFVVVTGDGDDVVRVFSGLDGNYAPRQDLATDLVVHAGRGFDVLSFPGLKFAMRADLAQRSATWHLSHAQWASVQRFRAGVLNDVVRGSSRADSIFGSTGDDELHGLGGDDVLVGDNGQDTGVGGAGHDLCRTERRFTC